MAIIFSTSLNLVEQLFHFSIVGMLFQALFENLGRLSAEKVKKKTSIWAKGIVGQKRLLESGSRNAYKIRILLL